MVTGDEDEWQWRGGGAVPNQGEDHVDVTDHGKRGMGVEKKRVLTTKTLVCSEATEMAGDGGNRR